LNVIFTVLYGSKIVDRSIFFYMKCYHGSYKIKFGQRFHTPIKLQKITMNFID